MAGVSNEGLQYKGGLLALPTNIRLGCKWLAVSNAVAYYDHEANYSCKKFYPVGPICVGFSRKLVNWKFSIFKKLINFLVLLIFLDRITRYLMIEKIDINKQMNKMKLKIDKLK